MKPNSRVQSNHLTQNTLLVMAGGTGGHIFPGIAVADELKSQGWHIHWLGTADKMEASIVPEHGYDISFLEMSGLRGKSLFTKLGIPFKLFKSFLQAKRVIKNVKPTVVLGMGGYASAPGGVAAWITRTPLIIHEQNAAAGLSNRMLARIANKVCCAFPNAFPKTVEAEVVGNPLRSDIGKVNVKTPPQVKESDEQDNEQKPKTKKILVFGGSLGARVLNQVTPGTFKALQSIDDSYYLWHQTGAGNANDISDAYDKADLASGKVKVSEFITDMASAYQWADLVICRAGALTVSELAMAATPAIFVPLPHAVDDHQTKNAMYLVNRDAARLLPQTELNKETLTTLITELFAKPDTLTNMANASVDAANINATKNVANLCIELSKAKDPTQSSSTKR